MAKSGTKKKRKKKGSFRRRFACLVLFLLAAAAIWLGRHDLLWGGKGHLLGRVDFYRIEDQSDLPSPSESGAWPAEVVGIPDYKNASRLPREGQALTCYRVVGFGNRLCVCTEKGLRAPQAIDEIIKEHTVRGRLEYLNKSQMNDSLRRLFLKSRGIRLEEDAFLLYEDPKPLPSPVKLGVLAFCLVLCSLSAYGVIK